MMKHRSVILQILDLNLILFCMNLMIQKLLLVNDSRFAVSQNTNQGNSKTKELSWYWFRTSLPQLNVLYYLYYKSVTPETFRPTCFQLITVTMGVVLFMTGWLADVYFGRYKVLR